MTNKHSKMFKAWYEDNILSPWETTTNKRGVKESRKVKHIRATQHDRLGKAWEHERIWND